LTIEDEASSCLDADAQRCAIDRDRPARVAMPDETDALGPPYGEIWNLMAEGRIVPFLGAGASLAGRPENVPWSKTAEFFPNARELADFLAVPAVFPAAERNERDDLARVLEARAKDLVGLNVSAAAATDPATKQAFVAAAKDVVNSVKILALIRAEAAAKQLRDQLEQFFVQTVVPKLLALLPALLGL